MARPLTNTKANGAFYVRPPAIKARIDGVLDLSRSDLQTRLLITNHRDPAYLRSERLGYLVREGRRSGDQQLLSVVLPDARP